MAGNPMLLRERFPRLRVLTIWRLKALRRQLSNPIPFFSLRRLAVGLSFSKWLTRRNP
jgi:hypothetical protein